MTFWSSPQLHLTLLFDLTFPSFPFCLLCLLSYCILNYCPPDSQLSPNFLSSVLKQVFCNTSYITDDDRCIVCRNVWIKRFPWASVAKLSISRTICILVVCSSLEVNECEQEKDFKDIYEMTWVIHTRFFIAWADLTLFARNVFNNPLRPLEPKVCTFNSISFMASFFKMPITHKAVLLLHSLSKMGGLWSWASEQSVQTKTTC